MNEQPLATRGWSILKKVIVAVIVVILVIFALLIILAIYISFTRSGSVSQSYPNYSTGAGVSDSGLNFFEEDSSMPNKGRTESVVPPSAGTPTVPVAQIDQKVIKTASLAIMVAEVEQTVSKITNETSAMSGFVQNSSVSETTTGQKYANLVVRVPVANFDKMIAKIKSFAQLVEREDINGREVTQEYVDLQSSLTHNLAVEAQYLELLKRAQKVEEIIAVREKLDQVQAEIENLKGRIRYLDNQTEMSTISINISSEVKVTLPANKWQPWEVVKESAQKLIVGLQGFVNFIIVLLFSLIAILPYLIVILLIGLFIRWLYKKLTKPKQIQ
jgi:ABC-type sugar transport system permease subunit